MKLLLAFIIALLCLIVWVTWARAWLKTKPWPWAQRLFAIIEPLELALWHKSETILWARTLQVTGAVLTALTQAHEIDITPLMPLVPEQWQGTAQVAWNLLPLVITLMGMVDERLRRTTTKPLAMVAVSDAKMTPEVAAVLEHADAVKEQAVATIEQAKTEGAA